jgi:hypothetical protein
MRKLYALLFTVVLFAAVKVNAQVTVSGCTGTGNGSYATLGAAMTAIGTAQPAANISVTITGNTSETAIVSIGAGNWTSMSITPSGGSWTISGNLASELIQFNGADNVTINGLNSGGNALTISNTSTSSTSGTSTVRLLLDAINNTFTNCSILGSATVTSATNGGNVFISTGTTTGNDNNSFTNCFFGPAGANLPSKLFYANGSTTSAAIANSNVTINNCNFSDFFLTSGCAGIYVGSGNTDWNITNNKFYQTATRTFTATGTMYGIYYSSTTYGSNIQITGNTIGFASNTSTGTFTLSGGTVSGAFQGIYLAASSTAAVECRISRNLVSNISLTSSGGVMYGLVNATSASSNTIYIDSNKVENLDLVTSTGTQYGISWGSATNMYIRRDTVNNLTRNAGGTTYGIYSGSSSVNEYISDNLVSNLLNSSATATSITMRGIYQLTAAGIKEFKRNTIFNLSIPNSTATTNTLEGIRVNYGTNNDISGNVIYSLTGNLGTLAGLATAGTSGSATYNIYKNKIYNLSSNYNSATAGFATGIIISGGTSTTFNIYNNLISDIQTPNASNVDAIRAISLTISSTTSNLNIYYNTIYLNATSAGTDFGTSGVYHAASATATTANLSLRNNNIVNTSTANGIGLTAALRRNSGTVASSLNNFNTNSNNNNFYVGFPTGSNVIYYDGTNFATTLNDYQNFTGTPGTMAPRGSVSISEDPEFQSTVGTNANFLKYKVTSSKGIESGGANIATFIDDYAGTIRAGNAGYAGTGTAPDIGAWELNGIANYTCTAPAPGATQTTANNICLGNSVTLSLSNPSSGTGVTYQWRSSTDGTTYSNILGATSATYTVAPTAATFYKCDVTCQNGPATATSTALQIVFANNVLTKTDSTRCGTGTVVLKATGNPGSTLRWYNASTGGSSIGAGSPFTTPTIASTTTYYVGAESASTADVQIGTGSTTSATYSNPFYSAWSNIHSQHMIRASELIAAGLGQGNLNSVSLNVSSAGTLPMIDLEVKIGTTTDTSMTTFKSSAGFQSVYTNSSLLPVTGANVLTFTSPFYWDGSSNIVLEFCHGNGTSTSTMSRTVIADNTSYVSSIKTHVSAATSASTICPDVATNLASYSVRPTFTFNSDGVICSSARRAVTATVTSAPALTITGNQTVCNNTVATISVTSTLSDFNTYKWTPTTNLFTDAACTVPYVSGASATTVYVKSAVADTTTYSCTSNNTTTLCSNLATTKVYTLPASPTVAATSAKQQCLSGSTTFGLTPSTGYGAATIQWQSSLNNTSFSDVSGANGVTYTTPTLTTTTYYRVAIKIGTNTCNNSNADTIIVNSPSVVSKVDSFRCGTGPVTLKATGSPGSTLNWYTASSGGTSVATGSPFVTPTISATTNYYVSASQGGSSGITIPGDGAWNHVTTSGAFQTSTITGAYMILTVLQPFTLQSMDMYPSATLGTAFSLEARTGSASGTTVASFAGTTTVQNSGTPTVAQTVNVNWYLTPGTYYIGFVTNPNTWRSGSVTHSFPWVLPGYASLDYYLTPSYQYYLYNLKLATGCESARTTVVATVNTPPTITPTASLDTICNGSSTNLNVTSTNAGYKYVWTPGSLNGAAQTVSPSANTTYTVTATDTTTSGPTSTCVAVGTKTITVNPTPSALTVSPSSPSVCASGPAVMLSASGGLVSLPNSTIFSENFNGATNTWTTINNSTGGTPAAAAWTLQPNAYYYSTTAETFTSNDASQFYLTNSDAQGSGGTTATELKSPAFSTINYTTANIKFYHYFKSYTTSSGKVEASTDGSNWTTLQTYTGSNVGTSAAFASATVALTAGFLNQPTVYIRFKYDGSYGYYWALDNVSVVGDALVPGMITWSPTTGLFKNAGATVAYTGGDSTVVYARPSTGTTYTVTAKNSFNCTSTTSVSVAITPNTSIAYVSGGNVQTVNLGRSINLIKYKVTNATGSSSVGLPAGVTAVLTADTIRISGTPTATGVYNYKVIGTGLCRPDTLSGTITVDSCTIDWGNYQWPPSGSINQCGTYTVYGQVYKAGYTEAPGAAVGMQAWFAVNTTNTNPATWPDSLWKPATFNVQAGNNDEFTYTFSNLTPGNYFIASRYKLPCSNYLYGGYNSGGGGPWNGTTNVNATLTVTVGNTAGAASSSPTVCINSVMPNVTHTTTGATGIGTATGLPAGVTASWSSNTITISGTPTASGTFNYSIPLTGGCGSVNATGTITVRANNTAGAASSSPTVCINTAITTVTHITTGATGIGTATGLPAGVTASWMSDTIKIIGTPTASGTFNYSIPLTGGCGSVNATGTITVYAKPAAVVVSPNSFTQCTNSLAKKLTATGGVGAGTYVWTPTTGLYTDAAATTAYLANSGKDSVFAQPGSTTKYTATSTNTNNCSSADTSLIIVNCTLPVSYLNFAGVREAGNNVLRWTTSTEQNNKGFDVERSIDGRTFSSLGFVTSKADNGNSNHELSYNFIDNQLTASVYYYRLRQVDLNGKTNYSNTIVIKGDRVNTIKMSGLYPNPATEEITVSIDAPNAEKVVLVVTDIYGKQLMQQQISVEVGSNNTKLNVANLSSGTYLIKLQSTKTNTSSTLKFIKQ